MAQETIRFLNIGNIKEVEKELARYRKAFYETPSVPFPTAQDAIETVIETASYLSGDVEKIAFVEAVCRGLIEWRDKKYQD